jgi:hypothetical protein
MNQSINHAARIAFLAWINLQRPIRSHDRTNHETRILAEICGVDIRTIERDIHEIAGYQRRLNELMEKYNKVK